MKKHYRRRSHGVSLLHAHIVTCAKYRRRVLTARVFEHLRASMRRTARALGVDLIALEAEGDHLHLMIEYPPSLSLSLSLSLGEIIRRLKGASARAGARRALSGGSQAPLGRPLLVALVFRRELWRGPARDRQGLCRQPDQHGTSRAPRSQRPGTPCEWEIRMDA